MALTMQLSRKGVTPRRIHTIANVKLDKVGDAFAITRVEPEMEADIPETCESWVEIVGSKPPPIGATIELGSGSPFVVGFSYQWQLTIPRSNT
jgi:hypothetical protein